jgi:hypothetical protein
VPVDPRLPGLVRIATLVKDMHLAELRRAEAERAALLGRIATLSETPTAPADLAPAVAVDVVMRYERWAELRRREVEAALALKIQECEALKARARLSVGRDGALTKLVVRTSE